MDVKKSDAKKNIFFRGAWRILLVKGDSTAEDVTVYRLNGMNDRLRLNLIHIM